MHNIKWIIGYCLVVLVCCTNKPQGDVESDLSYRKEQRRMGKTITGKAIGVSDGDTFRMLIEGKKTVRIRLYGVDAPEKAQDYGTQAKQGLSDLVFSKEVEVVEKTKDRYGRIVGIAYVNNINVNEQMLRDGLLWHYIEYDKSHRWAGLQEDAKKNRRGLWSKPGAVPPWQWRKEKRLEHMEVARETDGL